ncbi:hypothetical protein AOLI_G00042760 [Acnodon oligacanthus]
MSPSPRARPGTLTAEKHRANGACAHLTAALQGSAHSVLTACQPRPFYSPSAPSDWPNTVRVTARPPTLIGRTLRWNVSHMQIRLAGAEQRVNILQHNVLLLTNAAAHNPDDSPSNAHTMPSSVRRSKTPSVTSSVLIIVSYYDARNTVLSPTADRTAVPHRSQQHLPISATITAREKRCR